MALAGEPTGAPTAKAWTRKAQLPGRGRRMLPQGRIRTWPTNQYRTFELGMPMLQSGTKGPRIFHLSQCETASGCLIKRGTVSTLRSPAVAAIA